MFSFATRQVYKVNLAKGCIAGHRYCDECTRPPHAVGGQTVCSTCSGCVHVPFTNATFHRGSGVNLIQFLSRKWISQTTYWSAHCMVCPSTNTIAYNLNYMYVKALSIRYALHAGNVKRQRQYVKSAVLTQRCKLCPETSKKMCLQHEQVFLLTPMDRAMLRQCIAPTVDECTKK